MKDFRDHLRHLRLIAILRACAGDAPGVGGVAGSRREDGRLSGMPAPTASGLGSALFSPKMPSGEVRAKAEAFVRAWRDATCPP